MAAVLDRRALVAWLREALDRAPQVTHFTVVYDRPMIEALIADLEGREDAVRVLERAKDRAAATAALEKLQGRHQVLLADQQRSSERSWLAHQFFIACVIAVGVADVARDLWPLLMGVM